MIETPKEWLDVSKRFASDREIVGTQEVLVGTDLVILDRYVSDVHGKMDAIWADTHLGQPLPVTVEELKAYFITGLKSRVQHVRGDRVEIRTNERWYMPMPMANLLSRIGRVEVEVPVMRIVPVWNVELDAYVLNFNSWLELGYRLKRIEDDPDAKILFAHALEKDRDGDPKVMALLPRRDTTGRLIELRSFSPVDTIAAAAYLIVGASPLDWESVILPDHPFLQPAYYQSTAFIDVMLTAMTEVRHGKSA